MEPPLISPAIQLDRKRLSLVYQVESKLKAGYALIYLSKTCPSLLYVEVRVFVLNQVRASKASA